MLERKCRLGRKELERFQRSRIERPAAVLPARVQDPDRLALDHQRHDREDAGAERLDGIVRRFQAQCFRDRVLPVAYDRLAREVGLREPAAVGADGDADRIERLVGFGASHCPQPLAVRVGEQDAESVEVQDLAALAQKVVAPVLEPHGVLDLETRLIEHVKRLRELPLGDVGPRADDLERMARLVGNDLECVLKPAIVPVAVPEPVLDGASALADQTEHVGQHMPGVLGMQMGGPEIRVVQHLLRRIPHDRVETLAHEGARVVARGLIGVDDRRGDGKHVLQPRASILQLNLDALALGELAGEGFVRPHQLGGALLHPPFQILLELAWSHRVLLAVVP